MRTGTSNSEFGQNYANERQLKEIPIEPNQSDSQLALLRLLYAFSHDVLSGTDILFSDGSKLRLLA
jgi:hypothetical protein